MWMGIRVSIKYDQSTQQLQKTFEHMNKLYPRQQQNSYLLMFDIVYYLFYLSFFKLIQRYNTI